MSITLPTTLPSVRVFRVGANAVAQTTDGKVISNTATHATAIQAALDSLTASRTKKETVVLVGEFSCFAPIYLPSYTILDLTNAKLTKAAAAANAHLLAVLPPTGNTTIEHVTIRGGYLDGNESNNSLDGSCIISTGRYCLFENIDITAAGEQGIDLHPDEDEEATEAHSNIFRGIRSHHNSGIGIYIGQNASYNLIEGCYCFNNGITFVDKTGIFFDGLGRGNMVKNCYTYNNPQTGLFAAEQIDLLIDGLYTYGNGDHGLQLAGLAAADDVGPVVNPVIKNVYARNNTDHGIVGIGIKNGLFESCYAFDNGVHGFFLGNTANSATESTTNGLVLDKCVAYSNGDSNIRVSGISGHLPKNIELRGCTAKNADTNFGIRISFVDRFLLDGCFAFDDQGSPTQTHGINIDANSTNGMLVNNTAYSNTTAQITNSGGSTVVGTTLNGPLEATGFAINKLGAIGVRSNDGSTNLTVATIANTSPILDVHFFPNYTRQAGSPATGSLYFGYNADWSDIGYYSKWAGSNTRLIEFDAKNSQIEIDLNTVILDAKNLVFGTTTGTKIGTATTQKLGFYNATPIVQPAANANTSGAALAALETEVNEIKQLLRNLGLMAP